MENGQMGFTTCPFSIYLIKNLANPMCKFFFYPAK